MWFSSPGAAARCCTWDCGDTWGEILRRLAEQKESRIEAGHLLPDYVHMMTEIPPEYPSADGQVTGYINGKSTIHLTRVYGERKLNFVGQHFWARGYFVSTVAEMRKRFENTFASGKERTIAWTK
jgi:REP-associated tyrosine transposase